MPPTETDNKPVPVTPIERKLATYIIQGLFIAALVVCIFIDSMNQNYDLPLIVYTILGAGSIGTDNFLTIVEKVRGR